MRRTSVETHHCIVCGMAFTDEIHPNDDPICDRCWLDLREEETPDEYNRNDDYNMADRSLSGEEVGDSLSDILGGDRYWGEDD